MPDIMVSVCVAAYNHGPYIVQTLEGILGQQTDFPIEILVHDDCSDDETPEILREYAGKYPEIVKPLFETENQYSRGAAIDPTYNYPRALGRYVALCEGDDLWTDEKKLQRQVDYMESHPKCTFSMTNAVIRDVRGVKPDRDFLPYGEMDVNFTMDQELNLGTMCRINFAPTASFLFRRDVLKQIPPEMWERRCPHGDLKLRMFCTAAGYGYYHHEKTCVYRQNVETGSMSRWAKESPDKAYARAQTVARMLEDVDEFSKKRYTEQVNRFRDWYLYVMLFSAPPLEALSSPELLRIYRAQPFFKRLRFRLKRLACRLGLLAR